MICRGLKFVSMILLIFVVISPVLARTKGSGQNKIQQPVFQRIISLKPNITMILMGLGLANEIVGVTKFCPLPNSEAQVVADYNTVDLEAVIRLKPDLIILSPENSQSRQYETLQAAKLNIQIFDFKTYDEMKSSVLAMGKTLDREEKAKEIVFNMDLKLDQLRKKNIEPSSLPKTFIVLVQRHPLMIASGNTYISTLFERAGLKNVFGPNKVAYPVVDEEEVIRELVDYTFDVSHRPDGPFEEQFLNKKAIPLNTQDFVAAPQSVDHLEKLFTNLSENQPPSGL